MLLMAFLQFYWGIDIHLVVAQAFLDFIVYINHMARNGTAAVYFKVRFFYPFLNFLLHLAAAFAVAVYAYRESVEPAGVLDDFIWGCVGCGDPLLQPPEPFWASVPLAEKIRGVKYDWREEAVVRFLPFLKASEDFFI